MADQGRSPAVAKKFDSNFQRPRLRRCIAIGALAHALSVTRSQGKLLPLVTAECSRVVIRIVGGPHALRNLIAHDAAYQKSKTGKTCFLFTPLFGSVYYLPHYSGRTTSLAQGSANRRCGNGACRSDPVWPTGTQYNARSTFARFCTFVLLPSPNSIIFAKRGESTNEYKRNTKT